MQLETIPAEAEDLLYEWQKAEIIKKIKTPIVAVVPGDPAWQELDDLLTVSNNILNLEKAGETQLTIHELLPGHNVAWLMDDYPYQNEEESAGEFILICEGDLEIIKGGGIYALLSATLFRDF